MAGILKQHSRIQDGSKSEIKLRDDSDHEDGLYDPGGIDKKQQLQVMSGKLRQIRSHTTIKSKSTEGKI